MPGVVDCHTHTSMSSVDTLENLQTPLTLRALQTARNLRTTLAAGVTLTRDAGGVDAGIREAVTRGLIDGPTLQISVVMLCQTGGHVDGFLAGPGRDCPVEYFLPDYPGRPPYLVDGEDEMRRAVRQVLRAGGDWIKVCTTGGVFGGLDAASIPQLSLAEVRVAVSEAARSGRKVMAHALGGAGIDIALEAGVGSIEHGVLLTEEQASRMAATGCALVPTLVVYAAIAERVRREPDAFAPAVRAAALGLDSRLGEAVAIARAAGVRIALGSDFATADQHGSNLAEIAHLHRAGLTVEEALVAATHHGAVLCGEGDRRGRIAPGYLFDAIVVDQDPGDLSIFTRPESVTGVFKEGSAVVAHPQLTEGHQPVAAS
jgi:imidazolonepropionase-like amidohydrolase